MFRMIRRAMRVAIVSLSALTLVVLASLLARSFAGRDRFAWMTDGPPDPSALEGQVIPDAVERRGVWGVTSRGGAQIAWGSVHVIARWVPASSAGWKVERQPAGAYPCPTASPPGRGWVGWGFGYWHIHWAGPVPSHAMYWRSREVIVPLPALMIPPLAVLLWQGRREWCSRRRRQRVARGLCLACGYDLRGSREVGRCPECGAAVIRAAPAPASLRDAPQAAPP